MFQNYLYKEVPMKHPQCKQRNHSSTLKSLSKHFTLTLKASAKVLGGWKHLKPPPHTPFWCCNCTFNSFCNFTKPTIWQVHPLPAEIALFCWAEIVVCYWTSLWRSEWSQKCNTMNAFENTLSKRVRHVPNFKVYSVGQYVLPRLFLYLCPSSL